MQVKLHLCTLSYIFSVSDLRLSREFNSRLELRTFSVLQIFVAAFCVQPDHFDSEKIKQTNQRQRQLQLTTAEAGLVNYQHLSCSYYMVIGLNVSAKKCSFSDKLLTHIITSRFTLCLKRLNLRTSCCVQWPAVALSRLVNFKPDGISLNWWWRVMN